MDNNHNSIELVDFNKVNQGIKQIKEDLTNLDIDDTSTTNTYDQRLHNLENRIKTLEDFMSIFRVENGKLRLTKSLIISGVSEGITNNDVVVFSQLYRLFEICEVMYKVFSRKILSKRK
jgi:hypothetical protein